MSNGKPALIDFMITRGASSTGVLEEYSNNSCHDEWVGTTWLQLGRCVYSLRLLQEEGQENPTEALPTRIKIVCIGHSSEKKKKDPKFEACKWSWLHLQCGLSQYYPIFVVFQRVVFLWDTNTCMCLLSIFIGFPRLQVIKEIINFCKRHFHGPFFMLSQALHIPQHPPADTNPVTPYTEDHR